MNKRIYEMAVAHKAPIIAITAFEKYISIWNYELEKELVSIETEYEYGGKRVVLSNDGMNCFTASYNTKTVSCFSINNEKEIWKRKLNDHIELIILSKNNKYLYCIFGDKPFIKLCCKTGKLLDCSWSKYVYIYESIFTDDILVTNKNTFILDSTFNKKFIIERETFAVLAVSFGFKNVCLSESGGHLRCIDIDDGKLLWSYMPPKNNHILDIHFSTRENLFYCVEWNYHHGGDYKILKIDSLSGNVDYIFSVDRGTKFTFLKDSDCLITSDGLILHLKDGSLMKKIPNFQWWSSL